MKIWAFLTFLLSSPAMAAGGFTWFSSLQKMTGTHIPEHVLSFILVGVVLISVGFIYRSGIAKIKDLVVPDGRITFRNLVESYGRFIYFQCKAILGEKEAPKYFSFIATVFLVILVSNLIGLIPGFLPPTEVTSTTLALGLFSFVYYNVKGCQELGSVNYLKHFAGPLWYLAPLIFSIEIISNFIRPLSLALRLRSNMMGDHLVLTTFSELIPFLVPIPFYILGLIVCFIQAYVFTVLSMIYISLAVSHHDHDEKAVH
ncbi:MAG: F0F1 ATP synthase subunit A [Halobacteriovoraceae bacterium]|nr:F0F1 ATP synthase subunit A [Halobacteriovoraceae bacterium]